MKSGKKQRTIDGMFRQLFALICVTIITFFITTPYSHASSHDVTLHLFYSQSCPHCHDELAYLEKLKKEQSYLTVKTYEVSSSTDVQTLWRAVGRKLGVEVSGVPFTVVGSQYIVGFGDEDTTGLQIREMVIDASLDEEYTDVVTQLVDGKTTDTKMNVYPAQLQTVSLPIIGSVSLHSLSVPVLTVVIALLDGFNPCAMWALVFLITLLMGMHDRRRMWILGTAFIATSGVVYFFFLTAWLQLFLFIGLVVWVRIIIGMVALGAGGYYLYDYYTNRAMVCKVSHGGERKKVFERITAIIHQKHMGIALVGIVLLAVSVNMVEALCSAGLPAVYTQVLSLSQLPTWQYYGYLVLYIVFFMLDDMAVFAIAMITMKTIDTHARLARVSRIVGSIILLLLGLALIFKPEWVMMG